MAKLIFTGPEFAGKSTIRDQFLLLSGYSFTDYERVHWREIIRSYIFDAFRSFIWRVQAENSNSLTKPYLQQAEQVLDADYQFKIGQHIHCLPRKPPWLRISRADPEHVDFLEVLCALKLMAQEVTFEQKVSSELRDLAHANFP